MGRSIRLSLIESPEAHRQDPQCFRAAPHLVPLLQVMFLGLFFLNCSWSGLWSRTNLPHESIQEARATNSSWDQPGVQRPHHNKLFLHGGETCHYKNVIKVCTHIWQLVWIHSAQNGPDLLVWTKDKAGMKWNKKSNKLKNKTNQNIQMCAGVIETESPFIPAKMLANHLNCLRCGCCLDFPSDGVTPLIVGLFIDPCRETLSLPDPFRWLQNISDTSRFICPAVPI